MRDSLQVAFIKIIFNPLFFLFYSVTNTDNKMLETFLCSQFSVKQSASTSFMGSNCPVLVEPACRMFHWLVRVCLCTCEWIVCFVLESWLALNYWSDVNVALFRVVNCVLLPQSTDAAFQIFLKGQFEWIFHLFGGWLLLMYKCHLL